MVCSKREIGMGYVGRDEMRADHFDNVRRPKLRHRPEVLHKNVIF